MQYIIFLVPTSPPSGFLSADVTVTTIRMAWQEIPLRERHGIIIGYELTYKKTAARSKRDVEKTLTFDADVHTAFLFKLVAYTNYTITLRGRTSVGYGPLGEIVITTMQGSKNYTPTYCFCLHVFGIKPDLFFVYIFSTECSTETILRCQFYWAYKHLFIVGCFGSRGTARYIVWL